LRSISERARFAEKTGTRGINHFAEGRAVRKKRSGRAILRKWIAVLVPPRLRGRDGVTERRPSFSGVVSRGIERESPLEIGEEEKKVQ